jgi:hypothetical protein
VNSHLADKKYPSDKAIADNVGSEAWCKKELLHERLHGERPGILT